MLKTLALILLGLWLIGLVADVAAGVIHLLLIVALVVLVYDLLVKRGHRRI